MGRRHLQAEDLWPDPWKFEMVGFTLPVASPDEDDRVSVHSVDRHSIASTVNTTTSLASRIRDLNLFECGAEEKEGDEGKDADRVVHSPLPEGSEEEHDDPASVPEDGENGRAGALSEEELSISHTLHLMQRDPPLQVCCRLFDRRLHPPLPLKRMSMVQVEDFRQHGYVVMDNFISKDAAARIKAEALRHNHRGLLQPVSLANIGVLSLSAGNIALPAPGLSSSPCSACSGHSQHTSNANGCTSSNGMQQQQPQLQQLQQPQLQRVGELRMPLVLGHPPADTAVFAPVMAALQELQEDLSEFVRLRSKGTAEYCLCQLSAGSLTVPRHRDALPDDGKSSSFLGFTPGQPAATAPSNQQPGQQQLCNGAAAAVAPSAADNSSCNGSVATAEQLPQQQQQRRVSVFVFVNADWEKEGGGGLRLWPPQRPVGPSSATAASAAARRSPTSSDAGTTFSEISDCGSLRMPIMMGSTTSSVIAEASAPDHDTNSLDGISIAESEVERQGFEWIECEGGEMALDIAPLAGRVLVVLSGAVEHALLPSTGQSPSGDMVFVRAWCC